MSALLSVSGLTVQANSSRGPILAVKDLDLEVFAGDRIGIIGESGSGKTTTVRALIGLLERNVRIVEGEIMYRGEQIWPSDRDRFGMVRGRRIGLIFQTPRRSLNPVRTVGSQISEVLRVLRPDIGTYERNVRIRTLLNRVGLSDVDRVLTSYPHQLSGGMCQRIAIAMTVAPEPEVLIADEATSALDVTTQAEVAELLRELCEQDERALLFVTHDLMLAATFCTRLFVMYAGSVVEEGPAASVLAAARHRYTSALLDAVPVWEPRHQLNAIRGTVVQSTPGATGCAFRNRCDFTSEACEHTPNRVEVGHLHAHRCFNPNDVEPVGGDRTRAESST